MFCMEGLRKCSSIREIYGVLSHVYGCKYVESAILGLFSLEWMFSAYGGSKCRQGPVNVC